MPLYLIENISQSTQLHFQISLFFAGAISVFFSNLFDWTRIEDSSCKRVMKRRWISIFITFGFVFFLCRRRLLTFHSEADKRMILPFLRTGENWYLRGNIWIIVLSGYLFEESIWFPLLSNKFRHHLKKQALIVGLSFCDFEGLKLSNNFFSMHHKKIKRLFQLFIRMSKNRLDQ